jgi:hypothetical protein
MLCGVGYAEVTLTAGDVVLAAAGAFVVVLLAVVEGAGAAFVVVELVVAVVVVFADEGGVGTDVSVCAFLGAGWSSLSVSSLLIFLLDVFVS